MWIVNYDTYKVFTYKVFKYCVEYSVIKCVLKLYEDVYLISWRENMN